MSFSGAEMPKSSDGCLAMCDWETTPMPSREASSFGMPVRPKGPGWQPGLDRALQSRAFYRQTARVVTRLWKITDHGSTIRSAELAIPLEQGRGSGPGKQ